ncbi:MAG: HNH endonuclease [Niveispirillum sp.]|nr:HNH endonuclease [Niveispirillum sp.]
MAKSIVDDDDVGPDMYVAKHGNGIHKVVKTRTKTDELKRLSRSSKQKMESKLKKKGLTLGNIVLGGRLRRPVKRAGVCSKVTYPNEVHLVAPAVTVDNNNQTLYACFTPFATRSVTITYTGTRVGDYAAANAAAGYLFTPPNSTWHHVEDYNPGNNRGTMELVPTNIHAGVNHRGGVWQWEQSTGNAYG